MHTNLSYGELISGTLCIRKLYIRRCSIGAQAISRSVDKKCKDNSIRKTKLIRDLCCADNECANKAKQWEGVGTKMLVWVCVCVCVPTTDDRCSNEAMNPVLGKITVRNERKMDDGSNKTGTGFPLHVRRVDDQSRNTVPEQHVAPRGVRRDPRGAQVRTAGRRGE
jgi:hypothetical protein